MRKTLSAWVYTARANFSKTFLCYKMQIFTVGLIRGFGLYQIVNKTGNSYKVEEIERAKIRKI